MNEITGITTAAALIACHNRKQKTLDFLDSLVSQSFFKKMPFDIFLLDDGSTDGTSEAVKRRYPYINILTGSGNLFWAGGMRKIWEYAMTHKSYDCYFLFNDDVVLFPNALENLINHYQQFGKNGIILIGSTLDPKTNESSYGGFKLYQSKRYKNYYVRPHVEVTIPCHFGNANILLVDSSTVQKIGIFSNFYTHCLADYDYTLTAFKSGINVSIAAGYYGHCENDHGNNWMPASKPLKERIEYLYSPKGLAYKEYLFYIKKNFPADYFGAFIKLWMKTLFPIIWDKFKTKTTKD